MLLRSFAVQGSWDYQTLTAGLAFVWFRGERHAATRGAAPRARPPHGAFNSHPYLVPWTRAPWRGSRPTDAFVRNGGAIQGRRARIAGTGHRLGGDVAADGGAMLAIAGPGRRRLGVGAPRSCGVQRAAPVGGLGLRVGLRDGLATAPRPSSPSSASATAPRRPARRGRVRAALAWRSPGHAHGSGRRRGHPPPGNRRAPACAPRRGGHAPGNRRGLVPPTPDRIGWKPAPSADRQQVRPHARPAASGELATASQRRVDPQGRGGGERQSLMGVMMLAAEGEHRGDPREGRDDARRRSTRWRSSPERFERTTRDPGPRRDPAAPGIVIAPARVLRWRCRASPRRHHLARPRGRGVRRFRSLAGRGAHPRAAGAHPWRAWARSRRRSSSRSS